MALELELEGGGCPKSAGAVGASPDAQLPSPGCWSITNDYRFYNVIGWTLATSTVVVQNYCYVRNLYGYWVIYSDPNAYERAQGHWGWQLCAVDNPWGNWVYQPFEWGAGAAFEWDPGSCNLPQPKFTAYVNTYVFGDGTYSLGDSGP